MFNNNRNLLKTKSIFCMGFYFSLQLIVQNQKTFSSLLREWIEIIYDDRSCKIKI